MPTLLMPKPSPPGCAVNIIGDILGIQFDYVDVDMLNMEHKTPAFLKVVTSLWSNEFNFIRLQINPLGTAPVLKDGDFVLTDSHAILKYLLRKYGSAEQQESLYPSDLETQAIVDQAQFFDAAVYFVRMRAIALPTVFGDLRGPTPNHLEDIEAAYAVVEAYLGDKKFIATDHFTLADISVGVTTASMQFVIKVDKTKFPRTAAWLNNLNQIPAFKKYSEPAFKLLGQLFQSLWEKNKQKTS